MPLSAQVNTLLGTAVVTLSGRLSVIDRLGDRLEELMKTANAVILDVSGLRYVDAAGLGELVTLYESARRAGVRLVLFKPDSRLKALLKITQLTAVFEVDNGIPRRTAPIRCHVPEVSAPMAPRPGGSFQAASLTAATS